MSYITKRATLLYSFPAHFSRPRLLSTLLPVYLCQSEIWSQKISVRKSCHRRYKLQAKLHQSLFILEKRNKTGWVKHSFTIPSPCIRCAIISWTLLQIWPEQRGGAIHEKLISPDDWKEISLPKVSVTCLVTRVWLIRAVSCSSRIEHIKQNWLEGSFHADISFSLSA